MFIRNLLFSSLTLLLLGNKPFVITASEEESAAVTSYEGISNEPNVTWAVSSEVVPVTSTESPELIKDDALRALSLTAAVDECPSLNRIKDRESGRNTTQVSIVFNANWHCDLADYSSSTTQGFLMTIFPQIWISLSSKPWFKTLLVNFIRRGSIILEYEVSSHGNFTPTAIGQLASEVSSLVNHGSFQVPVSNELAIALEGLSSITYTDEMGVDLTFNVTGNTGCEFDICKNGATCKTIATDEIRCLCSSGYSGVYCTIEQDDNRSITIILAVFGTIALIFVAVLVLVFIRSTSRERALDQMRRTRIQPSGVPVVMLSSNVPATQYVNIQNYTNRRIPQNEAPLTYFSWNKAG